MSTQKTSLATRERRGGRNDPASLAASFDAWSRRARAEGGPETTGSASGRGEVRIDGFSFEPTTLSVTPGTVIVWTNEDSAPHTATANDDSFDSGRLDEGESGEVTFDKPGTFEYVCDFHSWMDGRLVVGP